MPASTVSPFRAAFAPADEEIVAGLMAGAALAPEVEKRVDVTARQLITAIRSGHDSLGGLEDFLRVYSLSTEEGLALMGLAEALLRVPDGATADRLIEDKLSRVGKGEKPQRDEPLLISASAWALGVTNRLIQPGRTPEGVLAGITKRLGLPTVRTAIRQAMRVLGHHFVLGETIEDALGKSRSASGKVWRYSYDMLGEGARTQKDADFYFSSYARAIEAIGKAAGSRALPDRPGISVKLSALHPRYEAVSEARVMRELVPSLIELARAAKRYDLNFTVDAEEADRLELSLDVIARAVADDGFKGWDGFGLAIQAYQKRAAGVIDWTGDLATAHGRRFMVRLVKGAYWDTEVKRAQERGLADYPVFTRKAATDLNYVACARTMLGHERIYPQFATHNALTVATILALEPDPARFEFQRLHGMGETLYAALKAERPELAVRVYAPVGGHRDLLAYLVRRLLENGANSSFVSVAADPDVPVQRLLKRPKDVIGDAAKARHPNIPLPVGLYGASRANSMGVELGHAESLSRLMAEVTAAAGPSAAAPLIDGKTGKGTKRDILSPIDLTTIAGSVVEADEVTTRAAMTAAAKGFNAWDRTPADTRATALERAADALEANAPRLLHLLQLEAGKTIDDAIAELREAVDFCRFYAVEARRHFTAPELLPGPTGEENSLRHRGRGVFVCISPWNFPLAIFLGQVTAALAAGNAVVAKPAEQTPLIAAEAVRLLHAAGVPASALQFVPGDGRVGATLVNDPRTAGVAFTGSTETAWIINRALAAKNSAIVPLIAETGGINVMLVDATALPEQVADDVVTSAFRSAGQRCSALRVLYVQEDVADRVVEMIAGAARELKVGDPRDPSTQVGPVIDAEAKENLEAHLARMKVSQKIAHTGIAPKGGLYVAPHIVALDRAEALDREVFGPILHVVRWKASELDKTLDTIAATGFGLTLGVHSRIESLATKVIARLPVGNVYVNRNIIGAVVGTQPFGGSGLSGTGPKAGGPNYVKRFAIEQVVAVNTAAAGGNAALVGIADA
jgi:RHH-type proline utilization regulon transcriptional repressor/proline dehydrogenase/delta 1-pyrroline-5-carboxylate dehydrogenase